MLRGYRGIVASSTRSNDAVNGSILLGGTVRVVITSWPFFPPVVQGCSLVGILDLHCTVPPESIDPSGRGHTSSFPQVVAVRPPR